MLSVDNDCPRKICWSAMRFGIKEIPPAADRLCQRDGRKNEVCHFQKADFFITTDKVRHDQPRDEAAVYRQAARPDIQHTADTSFILVPVEQHVVGPGADD